ncbi:MAG: dipeptidase [Verrucomicrobiota bacterium]
MPSLSTTRKWFTSLFVASQLFSDAPISELELARKAAEIHESVLTIDTHADTPMVMMRGGFDVAKRHQWVPDLAQVDIPRMIEGGMDGVFFACFVSQGPRNPEGNAAAKTRAIAMIEKVHQAIAENPETVALATTADAAYRIEKEGKRAIYIGIENGYPVGNDLALLEKFYALGVRYITLCHFTNNDIADSSTDPKGPEHGGLSPFGMDVVKEMNRLGIVVDVSHTSDETFWDAISESKAPIIASHSSTDAIYSHPRNLKDDMLEALAKNGGVIQINGYSAYLAELPKPSAERTAAMDAFNADFPQWWTITDPDKRKEMMRRRAEIEGNFPQPRATLAEFVDHIDHAVKIAGVDHVGIGMDFDGGGGVQEVMDISEMGQITLELVRRDYSEEAIAKLWGGNFLRVMRAAEKVAQDLSLGTHESMDSEAASTL